MVSQREEIEQLKKQLFQNQDQSMVTPYTDPQLPYLHPPPPPPLPPFLQQDPSPTTYPPRPYMSPLVLFPLRTLFHGSSQRSSPLRSDIPRPSYAPDIRYSSPPRDFTPETSPYRSGGIARDSPQRPPDALASPYTYRYPPNQINTPPRYWVSLAAFFCWIRHTKAEWSLMKGQD